MPKKPEANFIYLLLGLLVILFAGPIIHDVTGQPMPLVTQIAFSATLIIGIWTLVENRTWFIAGIVLVVADVILTVVHLVTGSMLGEIVTTLLELLFCGLCFVVALKYVLFGKRMDLNRIVGAICVYMLLGVLFGITNMLVHRFVPGSFNGLDASGDSMEGFSLIYYSFVTLTTLGYGDITPEGAIARSLAYLAAIAGQFYIAILVAMVVGQFLSQVNHSDTND